MDWFVAAVDSVLILICIKVIDLENDIGAAVLTAIGGGVGFLFIKAYDEYHNARTSALALTLDIASIMDVIAKAEIAQDFMRRFDSPDKEYLWADAARKENYFSVFDAHVGKLGALREPEMVAAVTRFYTFLKASRDATSPLKKSGDRAAETSQTEETSEREPGAQKQRLADRLRMISVSVCEILEATFNAGIRVIDTYEQFYASPKDAAETIRGSNESANKILCDIKKFLDTDRVREYKLKPPDGSSRG